ncbi:alpha/beta hydrolase [Roseateles sp.]|uniref:alpha/beta hydrolase n=1 Tax=Roseateles sp. TaxID=1971397 RepID=UPI002F3EDA52
MRTVDDLRFAIALLAQASKALPDDRRFDRFLVFVEHCFGNSPVGHFAMDVVAAMPDADTLPALADLPAAAQAVDIDNPAAGRIHERLEEWSFPGVLEGLRLARVAAIRQDLRHLTASDAPANPPAGATLFRGVGTTLVDVRRRDRGRGQPDPVRIVVRKNTWPPARESVDAFALESAAGPDPTHTDIDIHFGTNREPLAGPFPGSVDFGGRRNGAEQPLSFGLATVTIPAVHKEGRIERPSFWHFEFKQDKRRHMVIDQVRILSEARWTASASSGGSGAEALLFIHGFNVDFDEALYRTAQIAHDLRFPGLTLCFSWASCGEVLDYTVDEESVRWSTHHLQTFLEVVATRLSLRRIHVVAHSMGNRALLDVLSQWTPPSGSAPLSQIVLAAPDVDAGIFRQVAKVFSRFDRVTLYASSEDKPLRVSRRLHSYPRAGDATPPLVVAHLDTVDVSAVGADLFGLGHSYFAVKPKVFSDLFYIIRHGFIPAQRASIRPVPGQGHFELA